MTGGLLANTDVVLALREVTKRFGKTLALDNVSMSVRRGAVHALLGENGAGKTTLMRAAFGTLPIDAGRIEMTGAASTHDEHSRTVIRSAADAIASGIGMVHQHFTNVPAMTVAENVALGARGRYGASAWRRRVREIGERTGLLLDPDAFAGELSIGAQQRLEIVKALARDARILILDEPTAVLAPSEAAALLRWLAAFAAQGNAVVLITHHLADAESVAQDFTVLRGGKVVLSATGTPVTEATLASAMLGADPERERAWRGASAGHPVATLQNVDVTDEAGRSMLRGVSVVARQGEILGIAGVEGSGQRALLRVLARRTRAERGVTTLPATIGFVPEDRHRDGLVLEMDGTENVALRGLGGARGRMPWRAIRARAARMFADFDVRGAGPRQPVRALSGGNQQKLILARELEGGPELLVVENPTRGLDIRAAQSVRARLRHAAEAGTSVVVYSSDLDEVLALATRVVVVHAGSVREIPHDRDLVGRAMLGAT